MKTRALQLSATFLVLLASPAAARNSAWYVGGDFGGMIVQDIDFNFGLGAPPVVPTNSQLHLNHDYGYDGALFVGYDLGQFRIEAETSYKAAQVNDIDASFAHPPQFITPFVSQAGGGRTSALSFMVNGMLDFGDDDGISGFVGGGIGVARVDYNNVRAFSNQSAIIDDSDTRFAWQVIAGVRQAVTDNIDITLRYRFFNAGGGTIPTLTPFAPLDLTGGTFQSHSILVGVTYNFNIIGPGAPP